MPKPRPIVRAAASTSVTIQNFAFHPPTVSIGVGDTVTWTNRDDAPHTATGSGFDTGTLNKGQSGSHTFTKAGRFSYICSIHPNMKGTVLVGVAGGGSSGGGGSQGGGSGSSSGGTSGSGSSGASATYSRSDPPSTHSRTT